MCLRKSIEANGYPSLVGETVYNYFRDYDAVTGRYIQSDPIGLLGGLNTYGYGDGNPLSKTDPTGEVANFVVGAITGVVTGYAIAVLTGDECYDIKDALTDAALGATGAGLVSKANKLCTGLPAFGISLAGGVSSIPDGKATSRHGAVAATRWSG
jgi:RHS repeat-associated protein